MVIPLLIFLCLRIITIGAEESLLMRAIPSSTSDFDVEVSWSSQAKFDTIFLTWDEVIFASEQVSFNNLGEHLSSSDSSTFAFKITENLKFERQILVCLTAENEGCPSARKNSCAFLFVPRISMPKSQTDSGWDQNPPYIILGPINSHNLTVSWWHFTNDRMDEETAEANKDFYHVEWRKADGRVGHPGHSSSVVGMTHVISGLSPAARYEICVKHNSVVGERRSSTSCSLVVTKEALPGPPRAEIGNCYNQVHGTHWRCDVSWRNPSKPNGKINGFTIDWKDREGFVLQESHPKGALCDPICLDDEILRFHPYEVCVKAVNAVGTGWESCVLITDVPGRIKAFFERKVIMIIVITVLIFKFGPKILSMLIRCCLRGLSGQLPKEHPV